jgi:hypothetical protein
MSLKQQQQQQQQQWQAHRKKNSVSKPACRNLESATQ